MSLTFKTESKSKRFLKRNTHLGTTSFGETAGSHGVEEVAEEECMESGKEPKLGGAREPGKEQQGHRGTRNFGSKAGVARRSNSH